MQQTKFSSKQKIKVGINGFGRIGRALFRHRVGGDNVDATPISDRDPLPGCRVEGDKIDIVAINSRSTLEMSAHLLKYDSVHGVYEKPIKIEGQSLWVGGQKSIYSSYEHPSKIPWDKWGVELVLECSGVFKKKEDLEGHFKPGVKKVFVSAPVKEADFTLIYGVNHKNFCPKKHKIISNASCTTNCLAPLIKVLDKSFGVNHLMFTTVHSYTQDQKLLDSAHKKDLRRARAAGLSIIPTTTGAENTLTEVFSHLKGRVKGLAVRVPTANVSLVDLVCSLKKSVNVGEVNQAFKTEAEEDLKGVLDVEEKELVSMDFKGSPLSAVVDLSCTRVTQEGLVKVLAWYDNEIGFSQRMLDFITHSL